MEKHFSNVANFCDDFEITGINDQVLLSTGGIEVSWVSTHKQESGKSAMLHELAHLAYKSLTDPLNADISLDSRIKFGYAHQCLADNHPGGDTLPAKNYVEEDWSDLIASKGNPINEANVGCFVSDQDDNKYIGLGLTNGSEDDHSTSLFRSLHAYKITNKSLPSACMQYLENENLSWKFHSCL